MSGLWLTLSLLYAATFLQSSASADEGVSLNCNTSVTVEAGQTVTLNCSIHRLSENFIGTEYAWYEDKCEIPCKSSSMEYNYQWDNLTYVSLIISNVVKDNNYSVHINGHGGRDESPAIKVQVIKIDEAIGLDATTKPSNKKAFAWFILIPLVALGILYFLFGTNRGRKITKAIRKEMTRGDHSDMNAAPGSGDSLTA